MANRPQKHTLRTRIENGKFAVGRESFVKILSEFEGRECDVTVSLAKRPRSRSQNDYYWAVIIPYFIRGVEEMWGDRLSKEEAHTFLKTKLLFDERVNPNTGEVWQLPKNTSSASTIEMEVYNEDCRRAIEEWFGTKVPLPNEELELDFGH